MATDIEPNLDKPPPHLEGFLLKQNPRSRLGRRGWKSYFFFVRKDKLLYFYKKEDAYGGQKPILSVPLPTVTSITECEFDGVPKKHHINCGFSVVSHNITLNLLAEKPEDARKWVRDLCYVKAYWNKMEVRTTVLSVEQEKELLRIAIEEEKNAVGLLEGQYGLHEQQHERRDSTASASSSSRMSSQAVTIYLACDSKQLVSVLYTDTVLEVLDKLSDRLASSESILWVVDNQGRDILPGLSEQLLSYDPRAHKFYILEPSYWVVVAFFTNGKYEVFPALTTVTANEMVEAQEISFHKDLMGMGNPGVFLKDSNSEDVLFGNNECPFQVLFDVDSNGTRRRLPVGHLLIKNKSLAAGKRYRTTRFVHTPVQANKDTRLALNKQIAEEEKVQRAALNLLASKQKGCKKTMEEFIEETESTESIESINSSPLSRRHAIRRSPQCSRRKVYKEESSFIDVSGFVDPTDPTEPAARQRGNSAGVESQRGSSFGKESRTKSLENVLQSGSDSVSELEKTVNLGSKPGNSDQLMTKERIELESSKKISPVVMRKAMDMKRSRDRCGTLFDEDDNTSPITRPRHNIGSGTAAAAAAAASKSEKNQSKKEEHSSRQRIDSMTNADKRKSTDFIPGNKFANRKIDYNSEEARLVALFDQPAQEPESVGVMAPVESLTKSLAEKSQISSPSEQVERPMRPLISINIADLQPYPLVSPNDPGSSPEPYDVKTPAMLRLVQRELSENPQGNRFNMISLSGVILTSGSNGWSITEGSNYHDNINLDTGDHCEIFTLSEEVKATYHHNNKRWYVQPQKKATTVPSSSPKPSDNEGGLPVAAGVVSMPDFESKRKLLVQSLNKAVQDILQHFGKVRQEAEKIKLGDEAISPVIGQLMRSYTCPAILSLLKDGKKPYRFEGIIIDSLWDVIVSLCKAGVSTKIHTIAHAYNTFGMAQQVVNEVNRELSFREDHEKCQWFIISTIRAQLLTSWLECIPYLKETVKKYYLPGAFLMDATTSAEKLYKDAILIIDPLQHLPFKLYSQQPPVQANPTILPPVMKTHAATGQRSGPITGESAATAVTLRSVDQPDNPGGQLRVAEQSLRNIQEGRVSPTAVPTQSSSSSGKGWFKKFVEGLDRGGAITGRPSGCQQQQPQQQPQSRGVNSPVPGNTNAGGTSITQKILSSLNVGYAITGPPTIQTSGRKVIALYNNVGEEGDELSFNQGDVLSVIEELNEEWLMCQRGTESGIVPANYVKQAND